MINYFSGQFTEKQADIPKSRQLYKRSWIIMAKNTGGNDTMSKSKAKREARKREVAKSRRRRLIAKIIGIAAAVAVIAAVAFAAGGKLYLAVIRTSPNSDMSAGLTAEGRIDNVDAAALVELADYENISVPADEVAATAEEVDEEINSTLEGYTELSTDESISVADGDQVSIDYVGTIDGVEFDGGSAEDYSLTIGSGTFIDDFEQQLIGHNPGEEIIVEATFPDSYSNADLAGKDASFDVIIKGIMVTPELTDEFVAEKLSETEGVSTAAEYRAKVENDFYEEHLEDYLTNYIMDNSTIKSYPKKYVNTLKSILKYDDTAMLEYYNQLFASYGAVYENVWDTRGEDIDDELSYEKELTERAKESAKTAIVYQAIFDKAGLSIDMDAIIAEMTEENGEDYVTNMKNTYGDAYMAQAEMKNAVIEYLMGLYK